MFIGAINQQEKLRYFVPAVTPVVSMKYDFSTKFGFQTINRITTVIQGFLIEPHFLTTLKKCRKVVGIRVVFAMS